jgi:hypothetical protein
MLSPDLNVTRQVSLRSGVTEQLVGSERHGELPDGVSRTSTQKSLELRTQSLKSTQRPEDEAGAAGAPLGAPQDREEHVVGFDL